MAQRSDGYEILFPISWDLPCRRCGYNLRTLTRDHLCPECGTAVYLSLGDDQLKHCNPEYVARLARGCRLGVVALCTLLYAVPVGAVLGSMRTYEPVSILVLLSTVPLLNLWSTWLLTGPEPGKLPERTFWRTAMLSRVALVAAIVCFVGWSLTAQAPWPAGWPLPELFLFAGGLFLLLGEKFRIRILQLLVRRTVDLPIVQAGGLVAWGLIVCSVILAYPVFRRFLTTYLRSWLPDESTVAMLVVAAFMGLLASLVAWGILLDRCAKAFHQAAVAARTRWQESSKTNSQQPTTNNQQQITNDQ
ncbi:MAG: hypothetical protein ACHRHE_15480 [Tepidisphaerales bacterium]